MSTSTWTTIRTLSAQAGEATTAPAAASAIDLGGYGPRLEVRLSGASLTGSPTSVTLHVWRPSGGVVDKLGTVEILASDIATPIPKLFEFYERSAYVTVSFTGGTSPSISGTIAARVVYGA